jgi:hypothetical protein
MGNHKFERQKQEKKLNAGGGGVTTEEADSP